MVDSQIQPRVVEQVRLRSYLLYDRSIGPVIDNLENHAKVILKDALAARDLDEEGRRAAATDLAARTQGRITSIIRTAHQHGIDAVDYLAARARGPDPDLAILLG